MNKNIITRLFSLTILLTLSFNVIAQSSDHFLSDEYRTLFRKGEQAYAEGDYARARDYFKQAASITVNGNPTVANRKVNECNLKLQNTKSNKKTTQDTSEDIFKKAKKQFDSQNYEAALTLFHKVENIFDESKDYIRRCNEYIGQKECPIEITNVEFGCGSPYVGTVSPYGSPIYASDLNDSCFIKIKVDYTPVDDKEHQMNFTFRIIDSDGDMVTNPLDPYSSSSYVWDVFTVNNRGQDKGFKSGFIMAKLAPGVYRFQILSEHKLLYEQELTLLSKPGEATYLKVNGNKTEFYENIYPEGGVYLYSISTDAPKIEVIKPTTNIEERCSFQIQDNTIQVKFRPNYTLRPIEAQLGFSAGGRSVIMNINQEKDNNVASGKWIAQLEKVLSKGKQNAKTFSFKGESVKLKEHWDVIFLEHLNMWFIGKLDRKNEFLYGMYLTSDPDRQAIQGFTSYFIGTFEHNLISEGNHFDRFGNLIYTGSCIMGQPLPDSGYPERSLFYPSDLDMTHRLDYDVEDDGSAYLGETLNGKRHGFGIYLWVNGDCWFGNWENGKSIEGLFISNDGTEISHTLFEER